MDSYSTQDKLGLEAGAGLMFNHFRIQVTAKNLQSPAMKDGRGLGVAVMTGIDFSVVSYGSYESVISGIKLLGGDRTLYLSRQGAEVQSCAHQYKQYQPCCDRTEWNSYAVVKDQRLRLVIASTTLMYKEG